ncbi:alpha/beta fold hydrolase [Paucisalibacillus sp. EB02]|uniref:alpha/beta fold hydrolase n=1 Tax=Paucisalibacillus sp. EB02 TaxID=1347087 RepID=UPI0005AB435D|nr:alpha/beta hydrolase [Paucisalibacillus sp. EB02]
MENIHLTANDGLKLSVVLFEAHETMGLVQIIHGAQEHKERYYDFINYLNTNGFTVIISDSRGHGESINEQYPLGFMNGVEEIIQDQVMITNYIKRRFHNKDLSLFGHSLGSLFARCYLQKHDQEIKKLVLSGTANYVPLVSLGIILGKVITYFSGVHGYSKVLRNLNRNSKDDSWLSTNQDNIVAYQNDPLCQFYYQNNGMLTVFEADWNMHQYKKYQCNNPELEILSVVGEDDPVTGGEEGLHDSFHSLRKIGYKHIINKVYHGMRHEVLNEVENQIVYEDIVQFLKR